jgi:hypothetical protein
MWPDETGIFFDLIRPLIKQVPRFFDIVCGGLTFDKEIQIPSGSITAIGQKKNEIDTLRCGKWIGRNVNLTQGWIHEGSLAHDVIRSRKPISFVKEENLPESKASRKSGNNQSRNRNAYSNLFAPAALFFGAITAVCWGCWRTAWPRHGILLPIAVASIGYGLLIYSVVWICRTVSETADAFSYNGVSAPRYSVAENVGVIPVVVPEFEFRDIKRQIFAADLVISAHDAACLISDQKPSMV